MNFSLKTVNLKNFKAWDRPACYQLNITVSLPKILFNMGYWPSMRSRWLDIMANYFFMLTDGDQQAKKRARPISSHLDRTSLVNKGFII